MDALANFAFSTVSVAPSPADSGTTLTLVDASQFPDPSTDGEYSVTVWPANKRASAATAEIVRVTAKSGNDLTITRTQEGTSARSIVVGDQVAQEVTKGLLEQLAAGKHAPVVAIEISPYDLTTVGLPIVDGYQTVENDRVLFVLSTAAGGQSLIDAGIYTVHDLTAPVRATDWADGQTVLPGVDTFVSLNIGTLLFDVLCGVGAPTVIGTDPCYFAGNSGSMFIPVSSIIINSSGELDLGYTWNFGGAAKIDTGSNLAGFFGASPVGQQNVPLTSPGVQDVIDALVALGLVEQSD